MEYSNLLPLVRREPFVPLRVQLNDGRSYELRAYGQFALVPAILTVRLPYELNASTTKTEFIRIPLSDIKDVAEIPAVGAEQIGGVGHAAV